MKSFLLGLCAIILFVFWWYLVPSTNHWNQKLTMYIDTPLGEVVASSVTGIKYTGIIRFLAPLDTVHLSLTGEAVVADLGQGRFIFALLDEGNAWLPWAAYSDVYEAEGKGDFTRWIKVITRQTEERDIPTESYPMLVTFEDITDPTSMREVDPADLAATFGDGYALARMTLQVTKEPVTEGVVEGALGWWNSLTVPIGGKVQRQFSDPLYGLGKWHFKRISK